jgi:ribonuclease HI
MGSRINHHLYVDGSAFQSTNKFGVGWVITDHKNRRPKLKSKRLNIERGTSLIAELYAAAKALDYIHRPSKIVLHSDCSDLCAAIATRKIDDRIHRARKTPTLKAAWEAVESAVKRHREVSVFYSPHDPKNPNLYMDIAHRLAQEGASKAFNKAAKEGQRASKTRRIIRENGRLRDIPAAHAPDSQ